MLQINRELHPLLALVAAYISCKIVRKLSTWNISFSLSELQMLQSEFLDSVVLDHPALALHGYLNYHTRLIARKLSGMKISDVRIPAVC